MSLYSHAREISQSGIYRLEENMIKEILMKMRILFLAVLALSLSLLGAYQSHSIGLFTPSTLENLQSEVNISHNFYGRINHDVIDTFFGTAGGANAGLGFRQHLFAGLEARIGYNTPLMEYNLGAAWQYAPEEWPAKLQLDVVYSSFEIGKRRSDLGIYLTAQNRPIVDRMIFTLNAGYNTYYERIGLGLGTQFLITDKISLLGEIYPLLNDDNDSDNPYSVGNYSAYAFGAAFDADPYSFQVNIGNDPVHHNTAGHSLGAANKGNLHLGFNVKRRLGF